MAKFVSGFFIGILCMLSFNHFSTSKEPVPAKDTVTVQMADQTIEFDTIKKDTIK